MAKSANQKLKLLYMMDYFQKKTDANHGVSVNDIIAELAKHDIAAERKSIYDDLKSLQSFGMDIDTFRDHGTKYYLASREFELAELKLLADSVQSSKFLTMKKTEQLKKQLATLASEYEAKELNRQVIVRNRIKSMNESVFIIIDNISTAIAHDHDISFKYFDYDVSKRKVSKHGKEKYVVSPHAMMWDDENYYLIAFDKAAGIIKHFRVDKMEGITELTDKRSGKEEFSKRDTSEYSATVFGMFSGEIVNVKFRFANYLAGAVIDRFGKEVMLIPDGEDHFTVSADVAVSPQFYAWVFGFGRGAEIVFPAKVREGMKQYLSDVLEQY